MSLNTYFQDSLNNFLIAFDKFQFEYLDFNFMTLKFYEKSL